MPNGPQEHAANAQPGRHWMGARHSADTEAIVIADSGLPSGANAGDMLYCNGSAWVVLDFAGSAKRQYVAHKEDDSLGWDYSRFS
jgi:hypothetical protein